MRRVSDEPYGFCLSCTSEWITAESRFPPLPSHLLSDARVLIASGARLTDTLSLDVLSWPPAHPGYVYICIYLYTRTHTHICANLLSSFTASTSNNPCIFGAERGSGCEVRTLRLCLDEIPAVQDELASARRRPSWAHRFLSDYQENVETLTRR